MKCRGRWRANGRQKAGACKDRAGKAGERGHSATGPNRYSEIERERERDREREREGERERERERGRERGRE